MFELKNVFIEENKLGKVLWVLDGMLVSQPVAVPVRGVKIVKGEMQAASGGLGAIEVVLAFIEANKLKTITPRQIADALENVGFKRASASNTTHRMKKQGLLGRKPLPSGAYLVDTRRRVKRKP